LIKLSALRDQALRLGAQAVATGHYTRLETSAAGLKVFRAVDRAHDQTYFLSLVPAKQFDPMIFPLGSLSKIEARHLVKQAGIAIEEKHTSTEICFLRGIDYTDFLRTRAPEAFQTGDLVDLSGKAVGHHQGIAAFTIGQRRGIGMAAPQPLYVLEIRPKQRQVVIGTNEDLWKKSARLADINWWGPVPQQAVQVQAQIRYRQEPLPAIIEFSDAQNATLTFLKPVRAITPGQIAACYRQDELLGGGRILRA
jgi:tRNA-uridine 2-sulfurtransferase